MLLRCSAPNFSVCCRLDSQPGNTQPGGASQHTTARFIFAQSGAASSTPPVSLTKAAVGPEEAAMAPATALSTHVAGNTCSADANHTTHTHQFGGCQRGFVPLPPILHAHLTLSNLASSCNHGLDSCTSPATSSRVGDTSLGVGGEADSDDRNAPSRAPILLLSTGGMEE